MIRERINLRAVFGTFAVAAGLLLAAAAGASAQVGYDPYYGQDYHRHQKDEKKAEKRHQKEEKEELKRHQRDEREEYGNDADLREHQRQEREDMKRHERDERARRQSHQRDERGGYYGRDDGYYGNDGRYGNGGYGSDVSRAAYDRGYQEGVRAGRDDRYNNRRYDYQSHGTYRDATAGYDGRYGDRNSYRNSFRDGYQRGYDEGYNNRNSGYGRSRSNVGNILGQIFGRP